MAGGDHSPSRLPLGKVALTNENRKLDMLKHDFDGHADVSRGNDCPNAWLRVGPRLPGRTGYLI